MWHMNVNWREHPSLDGWYARLNRPSWVWRAAIAAGVLVVVVPLVLVTLAAVVVAAAVFVVLSLVASAVSFFQSLLGGGGGWPTAGPLADDGRRNVRVIRRP